MTESKENHENRHRTITMVTQVSKINWKRVMGESTLPAHSASDRPQQEPSRLSPRETRGPICRDGARTLGPSRAMKQAPEDPMQHERGERSKTRESGKTEGRRKQTLSGNSSLFLFRETKRLLAFPIPHTCSWAEGTGEPP